MEIWKVLLITLLAAVAGGCIIGVLSGKYAVKKATSTRKPLLSGRERTIYLGMLIAGAVCIILAIFWTPILGDNGLVGGEPENEAHQGFMDGDIEESYIDNGDMNPGASDEAALDEAADGEMTGTTADGEAADGEALPEDAAGDADADADADAETDANADAASSSTQTKEAVVTSSGGAVIVRRG